MDKYFERLEERISRIENNQLDTLKAVRERQPTNTVESDQPFTREQTAEFFGVSLVTIHSWENKGIIKGYHLGNKKFFLRSELMAALTGRKGGQS